MFQSFVTFVVLGDASDARSSCVIVKTFVYVAFQHLMENRGQQVYDERDGLLYEVHFKHSPHCIGTWHISIHRYTRLIEARPPQLFNVDKFIEMYMVDNLERVLYPAFHFQQVGWW